VAPNINRALPAEILKVQAQTYGLAGDSFTSVSSGLTAAKEEASPDELVFVGGSTFTVAEIV
jgi:dihydrofolate synthase/folylpolyglutamate synthase